MGAAAEHRGNSLVRRQVDAQFKSRDAQRYDDLTAHSAARDGAVAFQRTVIRYDRYRREWCLMNRQERGWGESCYAYPTLWKLFEAWRLVVVGDGVDRHGRFIAVAPIPR